MIRAVNSVMNTVSKGSSILGTGSQVLQGLKNPDPFQGISGILTATAGRSKLARKLLTIDSKIRDVMNKVSGIGEMFKTPQPPIKVWKDDPDAVVKKMEARSDPQMSYDWYAEVISPHADDELIDPIYIEEISMPSVTIETMDVYRDGINRKYVVGTSFSDVQVTFYLDVEGIARKFLHSWLNAQYSIKYGTYTGAFEYKKQIAISVLDQTQTVSARGVLGGVFLKEITGEQYTPGNPEPVRMQATLSVDTFEVISVLDDNIAAKSSGLRSLSISDYRNAIPPNNSLMSFIPTKITNSIGNIKSSVTAQMESARAGAVNKVKSFF